MLIYSEYPARAPTPNVNQGQSGPHIIKHKADSSFPGAAPPCADCAARRRGCRRAPGRGACSKETAARSTAAAAAAKQAGRGRRRCRRCTKQRGRCRASTKQASSCRCCAQEHTCVKKNSMAFTTTAKNKGHTAIPGAIGCCAAYPGGWAERPKPPAVPVPPAAAPGRAG